MDLKGRFEKPDNSERGTPFWAWNCRLDKKTIEEQIPYFSEMGMGGFIIHSRTGLDTPYLGAEFMEMVRFCVDRAKKEGLLVHLYDEDRWPSGFGGGFVTKKEAYRARYLVFSQWPDGRMPEEMTHHRDGRLDVRPYGGGKLIRRFRVKLEQGFLKDYQVVNEKAYGENIWYLHEEMMEQSPWFNDQSYMDTLNPDAVEAFLETTYEAYRKALPGEFGTTVTSFFTDEPQFVHKHFFENRYDQQWAVLPFTEGFEELFQKTYRTGFLERIPEILWNRSEQKDLTVRYGYHRLLLERFGSVYCDRLGTWCGEHGIALTGHMKGEGSLALQAGSVGEAMRNYREFQLPGIDILCDKREYVTAKQAQSVSRQMGSNQVTCELYGVTNWDFDFRRHKLSGDWLAALGVTHRVPHLAWMSMEGEAKRDFPASLFYQSPWYREYQWLETYYARIHTVIKAGEPVVHLGVIHPIESFWLHFGAGDGEGQEQSLLETQFQSVIQWLLFGNIDFDYISESLLELQETRSDQDGLHVGAMNYSIILVPGLCHLRSHRICALSSGTGPVRRQT